MRITVRLYSILRHREGRVLDRLALELPAGSRVRDALERLDLPEQLEVILAVNQALSDELAILEEGDELSVIPVISGGRAGAVESEPSAYSQPFQGIRVATTGRPPPAWNLRPGGGG